MTFARRAALLVCAAALTGCGSTVQVQGQGVLSSPRSELDAGAGLLGGDGTSGGASAGTSGDTSGGIGAGQPMAVPGSGGAGSNAGGSGPVTAGGTTTTGSGAGTGTTGTTGTGGTGSAAVSTPIQVGFVLSKSNAAVGSAIGVDGASNGDERAQAEALVAAYNGRGGLAGRKITPQYFEYDPTQVQDFEVLAAQGCEFFTQDRKVAVVVDPHFFQTSFLACLASKGVPHIGGNGGYAGNSASFTAYPGNVAVTTPSLERQVDLLVDSLQRQRWMTQRIGLVTYDTAPFRKAAERLTNQVRTAGGQVVETQYLPPINSASDLAAVSSGVSNAVLRFGNEGVDRVTFLEDSSYAALQFMIQSENQRRTWRYGLSSTDSPQLLIAVGAPEGQVRNSVGAGWRPNFDVEAAAIPPSAGRAACNAVFRKADLAYAPGTAAEQIGLLLCDQMTTLHRLVELSSGRLTIPDVLRTLPKVSFASASSFTAAFADGRRDGVSQYRDLAYTATCTCFRYAGALRAA